ncbi:selenide, water dikinase SelD [Tropicimonas aquimaris]|uniref:Selenide, water dikinase SelD n=1 Tax=Tropicimonas aquimaris TaxID=914152 RepID=A0ABW3IQN1_9RHOB
MHAALPLTRDLVLIGGGHTHALVLRMWGMRPLPGVRVTLINPGPTAPYSGMLPGYVAGHYGLDELEIDLVKLARFAGARIVAGAAVDIDREARRVKLAGHPDVRYDICSIDIGIHTRMPDLPGFAEHGIAAKPLDRFAEAWRDWCAVVASGDAAPETCVIGAGVAGVELALAMSHRLRTLGAKPRLGLVDAGSALDGMPRRTRNLLLDRLAHENVALHERVEVAEVARDAVRFGDGTTLPSGFTLGVAGARPHGWIEDTGLDLHEGYITVDASLRSVSDPAIFACGDCAHLGFAPRPKAGVYAVRAAPILFANLRAELAGTRPQRFRPQKDYLKLISMGGKEAVADKNGITVSGGWLWRWKDHIDRSFMRKFHDLPAMAPPPLPPVHAKGVEAVLGDKPLCGGCGAKVAGARLRAALAGLPPPERSDVLSLPGDDAAVLAFGDARQVLTTDHIRAFTEDPVALARITAVHALGDIWAMGARPQAALASITLPRMRDEMQEATLREILDTASEVFRSEGAELVGGHTSVGAELTVGFTLTGLASERPITLAGAQPGDVLLLTKPVGSGTVLAGEMQGKAQGRDVLATLASMAQPQGAAAAILHGAHAMTDVTGFGLAGHLMGICEASGVGAEITLDAVPIYRDAEELAAAGVRSTLFPANREVAERMVLPDGPRADLMFDPQTAGGLLAAVPEADATELLAALVEAGFAAARIGRIVTGPPFIAVL